ncbi:hypothetical protein RRG08_039087 [Elysia crispata]|uniref:Uncharacterized protein n=1 Tax=Elysia crispata TaxID=231223 RepID=A0AAE0YIB5_9GAST|nr:hypothetical protein RRG08_039087 [Elysia crispata]
MKEDESHLVREPGTAISTVPEFTSYRHKPEPLKVDVSKYNQVLANLVRDRREAGQPCEEDVSHSIRPMIIIVAG